MQYFTVLGEKWLKFKFLLSKPYNEYERQQDALFEPLTALIGPTGRPVAMRMRLKEEKIRRQIHAYADKPPLNPLTHPFACRVGWPT